MSASLVGSEMCIRDRCLPELCPWPAPSCRQAASAPAPPPVAEARCEAVSYTHLTLPTICSV
eukprot:7561258-Alexandrium_andersonii.AAC.1